jgi:hypothetical protein
LKGVAMPKCHLLKMFFLFTVMLSSVIFCLAAEQTPTVSVSISPGSATVKVKGANVTEEIGKNTAQYTISASCDPSSLETNEVKPVDPMWSCSCSEITFIPPAGVQPEPQSPGDPNVSTPEGANSWTAKVSAPYAGQWKLKFTASVKYYVWDKKKEDYVLNEDGTKATFGPYSGTGTCNFIATDADFKIVLTPTVSFLGRSLISFGYKETAKIKVEPISPASSDDILPLLELSSSSDILTISNKNLNAGTARMEATKVGSATITAISKNNKTQFYSVEVVLPSQDSYLRELSTFADYTTTDEDGKNYITKEGEIKTGFVIGAIGEKRLKPADVSFRNIFFREGTAPGGARDSNGQDWPEGYFNPKDHPAGSKSSPAGEDCKLGSFANTDTMSTVKPLTIENGYSFWSIPWQYCSQHEYLMASTAAEEEAVWHTFKEVEHRTTYQGDSTSINVIFTKDVIRVEHTFLRNP